jgi:hypothetical protein
MSLHHLDDPSGPNGETRRWLILASIRGGGFPHVAAAAYGVPPERFLRWLRRGRRRGGSAKHRRLYLEVVEAAARARLKAEMAIFNEDARFWLRHGLGRESPAAPGWTTPTRPIFLSDGTRADFLAAPEFQILLTDLLRALADHPEARSAAAAALDRRAGLST